MAQSEYVCQYRLALVSLAWWNMYGTGVFWADTPAKWLFFKITEWIKYHIFWLQAQDSFSSAVLHFNRRKKYNKTT